MKRRVLPAGTGLSTVDACGHFASIEIEGNLSAALVRRLPVERRPDRRRESQRPSARARPGAATVPPARALPEAHGSGIGRHDRPADRPCRNRPHRPRLGGALVAGGAAALRRRPPPRQVRAPGPPRRRRCCRPTRRRDPDRLAAEIAALAPATWSASATASTIARRGPRSAATRKRRGSSRSWPGGTGSGSPETTTRSRSALGGRHLAELALGPLAFRHAARPEAAAGEVSGHYHPKLRLPVRGGGVTRPCFLVDGARLILPAFGAYTGGLTPHPRWRRSSVRTARAILTGAPCRTVPLAALA